MNTQKILIVDDDPDITYTMQMILESHGYQVDSAVNSATARSKMEQEKPDLIVLDVMMPVKDGFTLAKEIRNIDKKVPILFLTAKSMQEDKLKGFEIGADDYLTKPFQIAELNARIKSVIRRRKSGGRRLLTLENLEINVEERWVQVDGRYMELNRKEFDILVFLLMNKNRISSKSAIAENIWGDYIDQSNDFDFIYSQIKNLRKKLRDHQAHIDISAVYGMGYKLTIK